MQITNNYALPEPLVSAIKNDPYKKVGDISVTGLIRPPRMRVLEKRHDNEIVADASDFIWRLLGQSVHEVLARADTSNHLSEERLIETLEGWEVSGEPDLLDSHGKLSDFKVTSVFAFLLGEKPEWTQQLNYYRWLYAKKGFSVTNLEITAILRDWSKSRSKLEPDYPKAASLTVPIKLSPMDEVESTLRQRVLLHKNAERLSDDDLPECSPEERWFRPPTFAVKKEGNKRAFRVFDDLVSAESLAKEKGMIVEARPGQNVRCEDFCPVLQWCNQAKSLGVLKKPPIPS